MAKPTVRQRIQLILRHLDLRLGQTPQRHNRLPRMSSNNRNYRLTRVLLARELRHECLSPHHVKSGDAEQLLGVEDAGGFEDLGRDGNGAVDGVGDDEDVGVGAVGGDAFDEVADDAGVDLEEVVTGHARFA